MDPESLILAIAFFLFPFPTRVKRIRLSVRLRLLPISLHKLIQITPAQPFADVMALFLFYDPRLLQIIDNRIQAHNITEGGGKDDIQILGFNPDQVTEGGIKIILHLLILQGPEGNEYKIRGNGIQMSRHLVKNTFPFPVRIDLH